MKKISNKEILAILKEIRQESQNNVKSSNLEKLDNLIQQLELAELNKQQITSSDLLEYLGRALSLIEFIEKLSKWL